MFSSIGWVVRKSDISGILVNPKNTNVSRVWWKSPDTFSTHCPEPKFIERVNMMIGGTILGLRIVPRGHNARNYD